MKDFFESAFDDDPKYGGTQIMAYGAKGSGKSMLLSLWALKDLEKGHTVIWRSKDVDTWTIFTHRAKVRVIVPYEGYRISREDTDGNEIPLENTEIVVCPRPDDAVACLNKGGINVICLETSTVESESLWWSIFAMTLNHSRLGWVTLCIDEINDIFESNPRGDLSQIHKKFKEAFATFRKKKIHVRASAHIYHDVNYEISYKFKYTVYLRGSMLLPKKRTSLQYSTLIRRLEGFQGILDDGAQFSIFEYDPLPEDVATQETVSVDGPEWSMNDYPSLMLRIGLKPSVSCAGCRRNMKVREGMKNCPWCGERIVLRDLYGVGISPLRSIDRGKVENEGGHGDPTRADDPHDIYHDSKNTKESSETDPFDPMNTPALPGMTKEEIMDLMVEKMIQNGQKVNKETAGILEKLSEMAYKELNGEEDRNGKTN